MESCWGQKKLALKNEVPPVAMKEVKLTKLIGQGEEGEEMKMI